MKYVKELRLHKVGDILTGKDGRDMGVVEHLKSKACEVVSSSSFMEAEELVLTFKYGALSEEYLHRYDNQLGPYQLTLHPSEQKVVRSATVFLLGASLSDKSVWKFIDSIEWADRITAEESMCEYIDISRGGQVVLTITVEKPLTQEDLIETLEKSPTNYVIKYVELTADDRCDFEEVDRKAYETIR